MTATESLLAGRYRVIRSLGAGGMGRVWLARDEVLRRDVAIKEINLPLGLAEEEREEMRLRTLREARAAARVSHPNVVHIFDVQPGDNQPWIVMEYVPSRSLLELTKDIGALSVEQVAGIGLAVLSALEAANRVGVLHRDVKPSNVLIADSGRVVLTDFGSALIDEGEGALTRTGVILGSPLYIAPERVDKGVSTPEADMWSLGATLYSAVEGRPPYTRETTMRTLIALTTEKPDPTKLAGPLKPVLTGLLQRKPEARMKPAEVAERLRRLADVQTTVQLLHVPPQRRSPLAEMVRHELLARSGPASAARPAEASSSSGAQASGGQSAGAQAFGGQSFAGQSARWTPVDLEPVPARVITAPRRRRLSPRLGAGIAATVAVLALGAVVLSDRPAWLFDADQANAASTTPSAAPVSAAPLGVVTTPSSAAPPPPPSFVKPAAYSWWRDPAGYRVAIPPRWSHAREGSEQMFFCAPGGPPTLRVRLLTGAPADLTAALRREEDKSNLPGYRLTRIAGLPGDEGAIWEYTFTDPKAGALRAMEHMFVANGHTYLIQWRTQRAKWDSHRDTRATVLDSFQPARRA